jgi:hypothetical protein
MKIMRERGMKRELGNRTDAYSKNLKQRGHLEDEIIYGRIISKQIFMKWEEKWTDLAQDRDNCRVLVDVKMIFRIP